jgi:hypothetical protein
MMSFMGFKADSLPKIIPDNSLDAGILTLLIYFAILFVAPAYILCVTLYRAGRFAGVMGFCGVTMEFILLYLLATTFLRFAELDSFELTTALYYSGFTILALLPCFTVFFLWKQYSASIKN